jgi:hypothetical protein
MRIEKVDNKEKGRGSTGKSREAARLRVERESEGSQGAHTTYHSAQRTAHSAQRTAHRSQMKCNR